MFNAEEEDDKYCVILGKELPEPCEVEICEGLEKCPYRNSQES